MLKRVSWLEKIPIALVLVNVGTGGGNIAATVAWDNADLGGGIGKTEVLVKDRG